MSLFAPLSGEPRPIPKQGVAPNGTPRIAASTAGGKIFSTANVVEKSEGRSLWRKDLRRQLGKLGWQIAVRDTGQGTSGGPVHTRPFIPRSYPTDPQPGTI